MYKQTTGFEFLLARWFNLRKDKSQTDTWIAACIMTHDYSLDVLLELLWLNQPSTIHIAMQLTVTAWEGEGCATKTTAFVKKMCLIVFNCTSNLTVTMKSKSTILLLLLFNILIKWRLYSTITSPCPHNDVSLSLWWAVWYRTKNPPFQQPVTHMRLQQ